MRTRASLRPLLLIPIAAALAIPAAAGAATINVTPGNNAIQKAVNRADNGDILRIHEGTYRDKVKVDKKLKLTDAGDGRPLIDGQCDPLRVVDIDHNGVSLEGLKIQGAREGTATAAVNFIGIETGKAQNLVLRDTCGDGPSSGAQYGVNVYQSGKLKITDIDGKGFSDAAIYIGAITDTGSGQLLVADSRTNDNNQGIIIEDTTPEADVYVRDNRTIGNGRGLFVHNSQQVEFDGNVIEDNATGIYIDEPSEDNVFTSNSFANNSADVEDLGSGNCGSGNTPEPFSPC